MNVCCSLFQKHKRIAKLALAFVGATLATSALADDWNQWRGPARTGVSKEKGLLKAWAATGPKLLWKATNLGGGYATPAAYKGRVYGLGYRDKEVVWAIDAVTGKEAWATPFADANRREKGYSDGSRSTPTIDGERLYALGDSGDFACLDLKTGGLLWRKDLVEDFGGRVPDWGYSESPLIDGDKVIVTPGGGNATLVAFNKKTGDVIWKSAVPSGNGAQYASAIAMDYGGAHQIVQFLGGGAVGVDAKDGKLLWRYQRHAGVTANIATPLFQDGLVFLSAAYGTGSGLVQLAKTGDGFTASEVYFSSRLKSKHGGLVLLGDYVYGFDDPGTFICLEMKTGRVMWSDRSVSGNASVVFADGHFYARSQSGTTALVEATTSGYVEKGRFDQPERSGKNTWAHPVVSNGHLYLRDQDFMYCYDVKSK